MINVTIGIDPIIAQLGPFALRWYSLAILSGIVLAVLLTKREFVRKGLPLDRYDSLIYWTVGGGIVGARLFHVLDHPLYYLSHPAQMLAFTEGGLAIYGAVVGGFAMVWLQSRRLGLPFRPLIDAIAPGLLLAQAVGRIGCTINGDAWGAPTSQAPLAFVYTNPHAFLPPALLGVPTHPYPLYDMALNLAVFAVIWPLRRRHLPAGALFALFAVLYAPGRFLISFVRQERIWFWGLQEAQVIALAGLLVAGIAFVWLMTHRRGTGQPGVAATPLVGARS